MGFKELETVLNEVLPKLTDDPFRYGYLRTLREINGNLDTIALCERARVELFERQVKFQENLCRCFMEMFKLHPAQGEAVEKAFAEIMAPPKTPTNGPAKRK